MGAQAAEVVVAVHGHDHPTVATHYLDARCSREIDTVLLEPFDLFAPNCVDCGPTDISDTAIVNNAVNDVRGEATFAHTLPSMVTDMVVALNV
jgi:hypothetical protein